MRLRGSLGHALAAVLALSFAAGGCASDPATPTHPHPGAREVSASSQQEGVVVTLTAATDMVADGGSVPIRLDVRNDGAGIVAWQSGGCELLDGFAIEGPPVDQPPTGRDWPGVAGLAKWSATTGGVAIDGVRDAGQPRGVPFFCPADLRYEEIPPGEAISLDAVWSGNLSDGRPALPGAYRLAYAFPYIGRFPVEDIGSSTPAPRPIVVSVDLAVLGQAFAEIPSTLAIDAALGDPRVAGWVDGLLLPQLNGAEVRFEDHRWRFTIKVAGGGETIVLVDSSTGRVIDVRLAAVAA